MGEFIKTAATIGAVAATGGAAAAALGTTAGFTSASLAASTGGALGTGAGLFGGMGGALSLASTGLSMLASVRAGQAQQVQYEMQARQEAAAARDAEIERKQRLVKALASQTALRGAQGISAYQGSPAAMMQEDIRQAEYASLIGQSNLDMRTTQLQTEGRQAVQSGYLSAGSSLLDYGERVARR